MKYLRDLFNVRSKVSIQNVLKEEPLPAAITVSGYRSRESTMKGQNYQKRIPQIMSGGKTVHGDKHPEGVLFFAIAAIYGQLKRTGS